MGKFCLAAIAVSLFACGPSTNHGGGDDTGTVDAEPSCTPGATEACYDGAPSTEGVGPCTGGTHTCQDNGHWGSCDGEVLPGGEVCANNIDDNCNGQIDEDVDLDGDGYTTCGGDCCDSAGDGCTQPNLVNPGAFDAAGNNLDDDCDGTIDEAPAANCDSGLATQPSNLDDYGKALDICDSTNGSDGHFGLVQGSVHIYKTDGTAGVDANQYAIRPDFGGTTVQAGSSFVVLSTGHAATPTQTNPGFSDFQTDDAIGTTADFPVDWFTLNNMTLPNAPGCPDLTGGQANDPVMLQFQVKTPTNAKSFSMNVNFFSSEFPEWVCSPFNDFFVVLLNSQYNGTPANPTDHNLAVYTSPTNQKYPVGVNLAHVDDGLFKECANGDTGCDTGLDPTVPGNVMTCAPQGGLTNTGFDTPNPQPNAAAGNQPGYCGTSNLEGGGTGWLVTAGNVNGGETITVRIAIWDTSDGLYDSLAIIDNFQWSVNASQPGTSIP